ncbi:hypothetical protein VP01_447g1, partial [Puccinia sorghi]
MERRPSPFHYCCRQSCQNSAPRALRCELMPQQIFVIHAASCVSGSSDLTRNLLNPTPQPTASQDQFTVSAGPIKSTKGFWSATLIKLQEIVHLEESRKTRTGETSKASKKTSEEQTDTAAALMHEYKNGKKKGCLGPYCTPGKHNTEETSHDANHSANNPTVLNSGATHHLINNPDVFNPIAESNIKISTGGHSNFLNATAVGTATLINHCGKKFVLENTLLQELSISFLIDHHFQLLDSLKNNFLELQSSQFEVIKSNSACYQLCPNTPNWHLRLGHPNQKYQSLMVPNSEIVDCDFKATQEI